jgi:hypothetical protein
LSLSWNIGQIQCAHYYKYQFFQIKKYLILEQSGNQKAKKNCLVIMNFNKGQFYGKKILQNVLSEENFFLWKINILVSFNVTIISK